MLREAGNATLGEGNRRAHPKASPRDHVRKGAPGRSPADKQSAHNVMSAVTEAMEEGTRGQTDERNSSRSTLRRGEEGSMRAKGRAWSNGSAGAGGGGSLRQQERLSRDLKACRAPREAGLW